MKVCPTFFFPSQPFSGIHAQSFAIGSPKSITKTADSGKKITSYFCGDCGTTLYRDGDNFPGANIIKAGVLDDHKWVDEHPPTGELFAPERAAFVQRLQGSDEKKTMQ